MYTARLPYRQRLTRGGECSWDLYVAAGGHRSSWSMPPLDPTPSGRALDDGQGDPCLEGTDRFGEIASSTICEIIRRFLPLSLPIDRERSPRNRLFRFLVSEFRAVKSFDCKTVLLPFYAFTSMSNFIIETSSTFWITRGLWRRFNVETTTTVLYTRFTFQFWNTVGKLSKRKSKFEYWLNAEGKSFLKYLLKTAFSFKSHWFNRGTLS